MFEQILRLPDVRHGLCHDVARLVHLVAVDQNDLPGLGDVHGWGCCSSHPAVAQ